MPQPMNFAHPPPSAYPVIPPMPVPTYSGGMPSAAVIPQHMMQMPVPQPMPAVVPTSTSAPVVPPLPQNGTGTPFAMAPQPPVIPAMAATMRAPSRHDDYSSTDSSSSLGDMGPVLPVPEEQYGTRAVRNFVFQRPATMVFNHQPLPRPPEDLFEHGPNRRVLQDLRRPVEEVLAQKPLTSTGFLVSPVGMQTLPEKKKKKGLFRAFSKKLSGKPDHEPEQVPVIQPVIFAAAPTVYQPHLGPPAPMPSPGLAYDPVYASPGVVVPGGVPGATPSFTHVIPSAGTPAPPPPPKSPVYSHRSHSPRPHSPRTHSPRPYSPQAHSPNREPLRIDLAGYLTELTHLSPHDVVFGNRRFPTALHALEAQRFVDTRPEIVDEIMSCRSPDDVRAVVSRHGGHSRPDWEQVVVQMMDEVLYAKFTQHPHLRQLLLGTEDLPLQFCHQQDNFWGDGPLGQGANQLGKALERVRERLRNESGYS
ncbi:DUF1768-domain-containing protein [Phanerochaete sordida]|uniref:DUF1768-domain-containing protein n=1 Tax=Phanerochaete sordida TaxID=48140 RepID=A0A9P3LAH0_9APHY|nr:DUF1768-domain-containing protein [Phanerochaete sordida]